MVSLARSQPIVRFQSAAAGNSRSYIVQSGSTLLVKSGYFHNYGAVAATVSIYVIAGSAGIAMVIAALPVASGAVVPWQGWIALQPGDTVFVHVDQANINCWLSGAALAGNPPFPPAEGAGLLGAFDLTTVKPLPV